MKYLFLSVLSGILSGLVFWVPIILIGTFYLKKTTGHYPLDLFGTGVDPKIPIIVGIVLAALHGFVCGLTIGVFKARSVPIGVTKTVVVIVALVAISHIYDRLSTSQPFYTGASVSWIENTTGAVIWCLIVSSFMAIPSAVIASLCVILSRYFDSFFSSGMR